jgi:adenosylcobyric acid synthase
MLGECTGGWRALSGQRIDGYEIHHGQTQIDPAAANAGARALVQGLAWQNGAGNVLGMYLHGLFESTSVLTALFGAQARTLDAVFDRLADHIDAHFAPGALDALLA